MPELAPGNLPGITFGKTLKTRPTRPRNIRIFKQAPRPTRTPLHRTTQTQIQQ